MHRVFKEAKWGVRDRLKINYSARVYPNEGLCVQVKRCGSHSFIIAWVKQTLVQNMTSTLICVSFKGGQINSRKCFICVKAYKSLSVFSCKMMFTWIFNQCLFIKAFYLHLNIQIGIRGTKKSNIWSTWTAFSNKSRTKSLQNNPFHSHPGQCPRSTHLILTPDRHGACFSKKLIHLNYCKFWNASMKGHHVFFPIECWRFFPV